MCTNVQKILQNHHLEEEEEEEALTSVQANFWAGDFF